MTRCYCCSWNALKIIDLALSKISFKILSWCIFLKSCYYRVTGVIRLWLEGSVVPTFRSWPTKSLLFQSLDLSYSRHCQDYMVGVMWTNVHLELGGNCWAYLYSWANPRFDWCFWLQSIMKSNLLDSHFTARICRWLKAAFYMVHLPCFLLWCLSKSKSIPSSEKKKEV